MNETPTNRPKDATKPSSSIGHFLRRIRPRSKSPATPSAVKTNGQTGKAAHARGANNPDVYPSSSGRSEKKQRSLHSFRKKDDSGGGGDDSPQPAKHPSFGNWLSRLSGRRGVRAQQSPLRDQDQRGAVSEEDLVSKSLATEIEKKIGMAAVNGAGGGEPQTSSTSPTQADYAIYSPMLSSYYSQDSVFENTSKQRSPPSYIRVSCALSGYGNYRPLIHSPLVAMSASAYRSAPQTPSTDYSVGAFPSSSMMKTKTPTPSPLPPGKSMVERRLEQFQTRPSEDRPNCERRPGPAADGETKATPVKELVDNFGRLSIDSDKKDDSHHGGGPRRPAQRPPPVPLPSTSSSAPSRVNRHNEEIKQGVRNTNTAAVSSTGTEGEHGRGVTTPHTGCVSPAAASASPANPVTVSNATPARRAKETEAHEAEATLGAGIGRPTEEEDGREEEEDELDQKRGSLLDEVMSAVRQSEADEEARRRSSGILTAPEPLPPTNDAAQAATVCADDRVAESGFGEKMTDHQNGHDAAHDITWYKQRSASQRQELTALRDGGKKELDAGGVPDEAVGMIDVAMGKARLLMDKKMKKFDELVAIHVDPSCSSDGKVVKLDDLEGYWQLVEMELEDIKQCFGDIAQAKRENWVFPSETPPVTSPKDAATTTTDGGGRPKSLVVVRSAADEAKEAARRKRIREMKAKAKERLLQNNGNAAADDVQIFVPVTSPQ